MKILIANRASGSMAGGVERMSVAMMNDLCARGHDIVFLTWDPETAQSFYELDPRIVWIKLGIGDPSQKANWKTRWERARQVRKIVRDLKPDVMIGFQHGMFLPVRVATLGLGVPAICAERNAPQRYDFLREGRLRHLTYPTFLLADCITIQCDSYRDKYPFYLRPRIVTIPNPVFPARRFAEPAGAEGRRKTLLCVARLSYQKNQRVLLEAFSLLADEFPEWDLLFVGEGEERKVLEEMVARRSLENRVSLPGAIVDVGSLYCSSHLFCLPSRWEGFPNVLAESLAHGLPVVGFEGCAGVSDLIVSGKNGLLVKGNENPETLAEGLRTAMADAGLRARMGEEGVRSMAQYEPEKIFARWESLFQEVSGR